MQTWIERALVTLPWLSLFLGAVAWLRYGLDMPWYDDWRGYADGTIASLDPRHLFRPLNDTMAPIGFALDALAQRHLGGNAVAYQFLSMVAVLGSLLLLQWKLLQRTLENRLLTCVCFAFTLFMLQPDSYWGRENLAYHQALPLVFILAALWIMVAARVGRWWHGPVLFGLGLMAGLTYVSGAFGAVTAGAAVLLVARLCYRDQARRRLTRSALWFSAAGAATAALQFAVAVWPGRGTHAGIPMSLPHEAQFWSFFLGKLGRSLLLEGLRPQLALLLTVLVCTAAVAMGLLLLRRASDPQSSEKDQRLAAIYTSLAAVVLVYMLMVAAGRARFRPPEMVGLLDIFSYAFTRFHFFWATLLWPWLAAALLWHLPAGPDRRWVRATAGAAFALALGLVVVSSTGLRHMSHQHSLAMEREPIANCLLNALQREGPVECVGLLPPRFHIKAPDAYGAYAHAWNINASFVRNFPVLSGAQRADKVPAFYQLTRGLGSLSTDQITYLGGRKAELTGADPKLFVNTGQPGILGTCLDLAVEVEIKAQLGGPAKLYWLPRGSGDFTEVNSQLAEVRGGGELQTLRFRARSADGFVHPVRFDPGVQPQALEVPDLRIYCLQRKSR